jgi:sortase (surface protein transpeptidase)
VPQPPPAPIEAPPVDPFHLTIDRIGVDAPVVAVGVEPGTNEMQIPGLDDVGWYQYGSLPGDATGTAVLVGHVDGDGRPGVFANLRDLVPGDTFAVTLPDGTARAFAVTGLQQFDKQALPSDLFARGGPPRLALITCGGPFDPATGHYVDNVVVVAAAL